MGEHRAPQVNQLPPEPEWGFAESVATARLDSRWGRRPFYIPLRHGSVIPAVLLVQHPEVLTVDIEVPQVDGPLGQRYEWITVGRNPADEPTPAAETAAHLVQLPDETFAYDHPFAWQQFSLGQVPDGLNEPIRSLHLSLSIYQPNDIEVFRQRLAES